MYNITPYGVRRAHSFDSYDNLEKWQTISEHRRQFLSTRAKFDKSHPSEPPPPPPRHASKFKILFPSAPLHTSSSVNNFTKNKGKETHKENTSYKKYENISFIPQRNKGNAETIPSNKNNPIMLNIRETSITNEHIVNNFLNKSQENEERYLESPGRVLKLTQSWQKCKMSLGRTNHSETTQKIEHQEIGTNGSPKNVDRVNEPLMTRKFVDSLGYEQPTYFQDVTIPSDMFFYRPERKKCPPSLEPKSFYLRNSEEHSKIDITSEHKNLLCVQNFLCNTLDPKYDVSFSKTSEVNKKPQNNIQEDRRIYLESILRTFCEIPLEQDGNDQKSHS